MLWVHVGKQHFPIAEDVPLVSNFGTVRCFVDFRLHHTPTQGFWLKPRNYFDYAPFVDLPDANLDYSPECIPQATDGIVFYPN